jgi:hypothetical protein
MRWAGLLPLVLFTGCAVTLPFTHRLSYDVVGSAKAMRAGAVGPITLAWDPASFPKRIDTQGASGFVGVASQTRIPTGVALASRIAEALDVTVGVAANAPRTLTIKVLSAQSKFQYSAGIFNITPALDYGECTFEAEFRYGDLTWSGKYTAKSKDKSIGGKSTTAVLEKVWDDVTLQVLKDVLDHLAPAAPAKAE